MIFRYKHIVLLMLLSLMLNTCASNQFTEDELPPLNFSFSTIVKPLPSKTSIALDIFIRIPKNELQFIRTEGKYIADYELDVNILTKEKERITGKILERKIEKNEFNIDGNDSQYIFAQVGFEIPPQLIDISVRLTDMSTKRSDILSKGSDYTKFYSKDIVVGSCLILNQKNTGLNLEEISYDKVITDLSDTIYFALPLYGVHGPFHITAEVEHGEAVLGSMTWTIEETAVDTILSLEFPIRNLTYDKYHLKVKVANSKNEVVGAESDFFYRLRGISFNVGDIDAAINQLVYIANNDVINHMRSLKGDEQKKAFESFWKKNDPTPNTVENELMEEYYRRVAFAISKFSYSRNGWNTDMGMIYILFGSPDDIARSPLEMNQYPHETWFYYQHDRQFVFIDRTGFGDYRLLTPLNEFGDWSFHY